MASRTRHHPARPSAPTIPTVHAADVPVGRHRGGEVRAVLTPTTCGASTGFMGTVVLRPGEVVTEHWHPYSEEFLLVTSGSLTVRLDGEPRTLGAQEGVCIPIGVRHRLANDGAAPVTAVFSLAPLAPEPRLGHVDTEALPSIGAEALPSMGTEALPSVGTEALPSVALAGGAP